MINFTVRSLNELRDRHPEVDPLAYYCRRWAASIESSVIMHQGRVIRFVVRDLPECVEGEPFPVLFNRATLTPEYFEHFANYDALKPWGPKKRFFLLHPKYSAWLLPVRALPDVDKGDE